MMKFALLTLALAAGTAAHADIKCTVKYQLLTDKEIKNEQIVPLDVLFQQGVQIQLQGKVNGVTATISGNSIDGNYMFSLISGVDNTEGTLATANFNKDGRLQVSQLKDTPRGLDGKWTGTDLYKFECYNR